MNLSKKNYLFFIFSALTWVMVQFLREVVVDPLFLHVGVALVFVLMGLGFFYLYDLSTLSNFAKPLLALIKKPVGKQGYRLVVGFGVASILAFIASHPDNWEGNLQGLIDQNFAQIASIMAVTLVPVYEEFFFRGAVFSVFNKILKVKAAIVNPNKWTCYFSALIFFAFHAPLNISIWQMALANNSVPISVGPFFLGLICAYIVLVDESLLFAVIFHAAANLLGPLWQNSLPGFLHSFFFSVG